MSSTVNVSKEAQADHPAYSKQLEHLLAALAWLERRKMITELVCIKKDMKPVIHLLRPPSRLLKGTERIKIEGQAYKRIGVFVAPVCSCVVTWEQAVQ